MAAEETQRAADAEVVLEGGTYDIIRNRLQSLGNDLRGKLNDLNQARKEIFGSIDAALKATERITTRNNCIPRDMVPLGRTRFIFGYNVHIGLRSETELADVFSVYEYADGTFHARPLDALRSGRFETDFKNLYKYYRDVRFAKFSVIGPHLHMAFRVGKSATDLKTFKWQVEEDGLLYVDNRSDHEFAFPPQHDFTWTRTHRDLHRAGAFPHISIEDKVFVEAVGGDITFKVEDNTETGQGIYAEPVDHKDQTLDDAEIFYAVMGHIILVKIRPYQESRFRYFIFNEKLQEVRRADAMETACVLLPDGHGLIFPNGYYLQTGEMKTFETQLTGLLFDHRIVSPNGEDFLYVFYHPESGDYVLLSYNLIAQKVDTPLICNGFSHFDNGEMLLFKSAGEPARHHAVQVWQTPYVGRDYVFAEKHESYLYKIGNPAIVRCMAECGELLKLMDREAPYAGLYVDMAKKAADVGDAYFWLDKPEAFRLKDTLLKIKAAAASAVDEFEKVVALKKAAAARMAEVGDRTRAILKKAAPERLKDIASYVTLLADLRAARGDVIALKDFRYADLAAAESLETEVGQAAETVSAACVRFLLKPEALQPYDARIEELGRKIGELTRVTEAEALEDSIQGVADDLDMLIDIVSNLKIADATQTTAIIDRISNAYAVLNQLKVDLKKKKKALQGAEGAAEFGAQLKLLNQSVINYLDIADAPGKCDEFLTKTMIQIESLESRFSDFDEFLVQLAEKRNEIYTAFESRKSALTEARNRRADALMRSAERILKGIQNRVSGMDEINAIHGYFASDLMIEKIREIVVQLIELDDTVKADDVQARLKTLREDAVRQLKDRQELFVGGENVIRFGNHQFTVNVQPLDLTIVRRDDAQMFHLTGTGFSEVIRDADFMAARDVWDMTLPSENGAVYRGEYLAFQVLRALAGDLAVGEEQEQEQEQGQAGDDLESVLAMGDEELRAYVQAFMGPRYAEGYARGVHDRDGAAIFAALGRMHAGAGLLRFHPSVRALARLFWDVYFSRWADDAQKTVIFDKLQAFGQMNLLFPRQRRQDNYIAELAGLLADFVEKSGLFPDADVNAAARYLFHELTQATPGAPADVFVISGDAWRLANGFDKYLTSRRAAEKLREAREKLRSLPAAEYELIRDWIRGFLASEGNDDMRDYLDEAAVIAFFDVFQKHQASEASMIAVVEGMAGDHPVITKGTYRLNYLRFMEKLAGFETNVVPRYNRFVEMKKSLVETKRESLRLDDFRPRVLTSFVRNRLINRVYLPLIGDNLAKQIGAAGERKRTDLMGLLLLISPPGYGKTTLMEYIANRLGVIFMKINGPAVGHRVTSLDPAEAPNAAAREEVQKLNLCLEMGDNVMLYLDDIQHCNPEFLQKFISLCDAQRKIEGVYNGGSRTYDLRGKKVIVVMAGNPYTESGEKFRIPDMLANRADIYNLGDIIGDNGADFKLSYLENALTSNPALNPLAGRSREDVYGIIRIAETGSHEGVEFEGAYAAGDLKDMVAAMKKLMTIRDVILKVNEQYIYSASQADAYRTEPPFRLQGSYRNMNRLAEKVVPIMNDAELKTLILSHYENESQTLTSGAEANFLKFKSLVGWMTDGDEARWTEIREMFRKQQALFGADSADPVGRIAAHMSAFQEGLISIREAIGQGVSLMTQHRAPEPEVQPPAPAPISFSEETLARLEALFSRIDVHPGAYGPAGGGHPDETGSGNLTDLAQGRKNVFYLSLKEGDIRAVDALLANGQDPNIRTPEGATPLMAAALHNQPEIVRLLIERGAEVNARDKAGYNALMIAASRGHLEVVKILMANGADPELRDKKGLTALSWAQKNGHANMAMLLRYR